MSVPGSVGVPVVTTDENGAGGFDCPYPAASPEAAFVPELAAKKDAVLVRLFAFHWPRIVEAEALPRQARRVVVVYSASFINVCCCENPKGNM